MEDAERRVYNSIINRIDRFGNEKIIEELNYFVKALRHGVGLKPVKIRTIQGYIDVFAQLNKFRPKESLLDYTKEDLIDYFDSREEKNLARVSINLQKVKLKKYFSWRYTEEKLCEEGKLPEIVSWINISRRIKKTKSIEDVITPSQMQLMINTTDNLRDKCLLSVGFEGGFRISELLGIRIRDITIRDNHAFAFVSGKTGSRRNILIDSYPHLMKWINNHPFKENVNHYLFIALDHNHYGNQLYPYTVGKKLRTLAKRVGIKNKKITCHTAFRHSRLTYLSSTLNWNEPKLRKFAGWSPTSNMTDVYCHGTEKDVYDSLMAEAGILEVGNSKNDTKEKEVMKPKVCPRCSKVNAAGSLYCNCGFCLNYNEAQNIEEKKSKAIDEATRMLMDIMTNPKRLEEFMKFKETQI